MRDTPIYRGDTFKEMVMTTAWKLNCRTCPSTDEVPMSVIECCFSGVGMGVWDTTWSWSGDSYVTVSMTNIEGSNT
ncbi:hypothetical protein GCM10025857_34110 [Alicyclobacillus contaminans]|nr:hypothetical protein GCM10025857_34110 [Alicyclobacillus contaminans]